MNRYLAIFLILLISGCHKTDRHKLLKNIKWDNRYVDEKQIRKEVRQLVNSKKSAQALKMLDTLIYSNKSNGFLYFEKGYVEGYNFHHEAAIRDYTTAERLHYRPAECQFMIEVSKNALNNKKLINDNVE